MRDFHIVYNPRLSHTLYCTTYMANFKMPSEIIVWASPCEIYLVKFTVKIEVSEEILFYRLHSYLSSPSGSSLPILFIQDIFFK